jgi:site-specific DNA-methyltransferase (adenine-specific)
MIQLFNADCLQKLKDISSNSVDLVICDLPFGCLTGGGGQEKKKRRLKRYVNGEATDLSANYVGGVIAGCEWDIPIDLEPFWKEIRRIRKNEHTPTLHFCTTKYGYELIKSNEKEFRYDLVWEKTNAVGFLSANKMPMRSHEMIYVFSKAGAYYDRIDLSGNYPKAGGGRSGGQKCYGNNYENIQPDNEGKRCIKSVFEFANNKTRGGHPTAKPVDLYKFLIQRYCPKGGTVLDPTFGSGNSGLAAKELGMNFIGIEKDKGFFEKAKAKLG